MTVQQVISSGSVPVKIWSEDVEQSALDQLKNLSYHPAIFGHVAAMPDVHTGKGAPVGTVIPTRSAIIPAAVGVDIGCGMIAARLSIFSSELPDSLKSIREEIEQTVPVGFRSHITEPVCALKTKHIAGTLKGILEKHPDIGKRKRSVAETWRLQLGTLGGGNHFIEVCLDEAERVWLMLHSGSRGIGNALGTYFIELAQRDMGVHLRNLPDKQLAYLNEGTAHFDDYVEAVEWAQQYAKFSRKVMLNLILDALKSHLPEFHVTEEVINCHHNYVTREFHFGEELLVTRKGAIRAGLGEMGIIPGSMGTASYIVRGKGSDDSLQSCSHGAGRKMSRRAARRKFNRLDLAKQTEGVECRKDRGVLDEIPGAYKDIDLVMDNQKDLVDVVYKLRAIVCVKG